MPTLLDLDAIPDRPRTADAYSVHAIDEDPLVSVALARGVRLFPALMLSQAHLVRNLLGDLIPLDFARLSGFGRDTLDRSARLTIAIAALNERFHALDLEPLIGGIINHAKAHAAGNRKAGLRALLAGVMPFDPRQARTSLDAARSLAEGLLQEVATCAKDIHRLDRIMRTEAAALAILNDLADHGSMGDLLNRRSGLIDAANQEITIAGQQAETLRLLAEQWIMRIDETRDATLPALGFAASL
ncbi:hypothetical protein ACELLULO517_18700 [Acidisoma cellulosilytica]|uniref:Uncharacterized protein n=1 Tax=Acidisoma cellulosilyticum TaxID=2802395 RepID=A0A964E599_9PROT|nr:hypothetical protein [Acidisoma cellulosilyticum]MCB8882284.1 hypothetical protein [Acidisoma cellulosilyticum]